METIKKLHVFYCDKCGLCVSESEEVNMAYMKMGKRQEYLSPNIYNATLCDDCYNEYHDKMNRTNSYYDKERILKSYKFRASPTGHNIEYA